MSAQPLRRARAISISARQAEARWAEWFAAQGWRPLPFQREVWKHYLAGKSGLLHTPTGSGKTLAVIGGALIEALTAQPVSSVPVDRSAATKRRTAVRPLRVLWVTPLRALAADTLRALREPAHALGLDWEVGLRTGDASARDKRLARAGKLDVLVTTPESLSLLLSYPDAAQNFSAIRCIVVDEWHELLGNKRGVLLQLCLARLRGLSPLARIWGLSATLGNLDQAREVLIPGRPDAVTVSGLRPRTVRIETLLPASGERFPWAGHLGLSQLARVVERIFGARTSLVFTNTRAQAELWHQALSAVWLEDPATLALHHGSLDARLRADVEAGLRSGGLRCVVATSSLDLGVDFPSVDQVFQIGSPKGVARLLQRAGRSRHRPGEAGHVICVPSHALELVEYAAVREAIAQGDIEPRLPPVLSLDVLAQHCVTLALGGGFDADALLAEVRGTHAFSALDEASWQAVLDFIVQGGRALENYPDYRRVVRDEHGRYLVEDRRVAFRHRLSIGTITSDGAVSVKFLRGGNLGSVEETFIARLRPGDRFQFAGRTLELVRLEAMAAYVRLARKNDGAVPKWQGGRMPLSSELAREVEALLAQPSDSPEMVAVIPLLGLQSRLSMLPKPGCLLVEAVRTREGPQYFVYPFAGRQTHEGLAMLLSLRLGRLQANTWSFAANDYGLALAPAVEQTVTAEQWGALFSANNLEEDLRASLNLAELARRQFREIARIAGLLPPSLPGKAPRSMRQLQASSGLIFDVLARYDPEHILLKLAEREVFSAQLEIRTLRHVLADCAARVVELRAPRSLTPLAFPLWAENLRTGQISSEDWKARVQRAAAQLEKRHAR